MHNEEVYVGMYAKYYYGDQMKEEKLDRTCSTHEGDEGDSLEIQL